jgi:hypothetical protein
MIEHCAAEMLAECTVNIKYKYELKVLTESNTVLLAGMYVQGLHQI